MDLVEASLERRVNLLGFHHRFPVTVGGLCEFGKVRRRGSNVSPSES